MTSLDRTRYLKNTAETVACSLGIIAEVAATDNDIPRTELAELIRAEQKVLRDAISGLYTPRGQVRLYCRNNAYGIEYPLSMIELPIPVFPLGKLYITDGAMETGFHTDARGDKYWEFDEGLRPYVERFVRGEWNVLNVDDRKLNTEASKVHGAHLFDAFTYQGKRYNIEGFVGLEMTVLLAEER